MIIYDLTCDADHQFEGWFKNPEDFSDQLKSGLISCPICASQKIKKLPTASYIGKSSANQQTEQRKSALANKNSLDVINKLHDFVEKNFEDVGSAFAQEARKMHEGESEQRNIRGAATYKEVKELKNDGISVVPLPPKPVEKKKLN
jgi:hypothetical protein